MATKVVFLGIGGSYLGAEAGISALMNKFSNPIECLFLGHTWDGEYVQSVVDSLGEHSVCLVIMSKSGGTKETAVATRDMIAYMEGRYGSEAANRIIVVTDPERGILHDLAKEEGYKMFGIPSDIGGRYSVLTPVGLLPLAIAGIDIKEMLRGAHEASYEYNNPELFSNQAYLYAVCRHIFYNSGKSMEELNFWSPRLERLAGWKIQLWAESHGKDGKGLVPVPRIYPADLHSTGQMTAGGKRIMFATTTYFQPKECRRIPAIGIKDGLHKLAGLQYGQIQGSAFEGASLNHTESGVPQLVIKLPPLSAFTFGWNFYFEMLACAMGGYLLDINPFDQPNVEGHKKRTEEAISKLIDN